MSVQRYDVTLNHADSDDPEAAMTRHSFGAYVKHQDYAALEARCAALAAENAGLKAFKTAVYQHVGAGCEAPEFSITEGLSNLRRFADTLHAIEREFFTKEVPDEECEGETVEECPLGWGMSVEQYVSEFRKCLAEVRAQGVGMFASKCKEESKHAHSSDTRDSWWVSGENADDFADQLRKGVI